MTLEEKQLLLKDLCARLPYGVRVSVQSYKGTFLGTLVTVTTKLPNTTLGEAWIEETDEALWCDYSLFKPYLRPLSSMTKEEREYVEDLSNFKATPSVVRDKVDFYLEHHLDYRGLIPMGLALEAKEGMYKDN